jgi:hypothetical protein
VYRVSVPAPKDSFSLLTGEPKVYIKTADSGTMRAHAFCTANLPPQKRIWCQSALPWSLNVEKLPQIDRQ